MTTRWVVACARVGDCFQPMAELAVQVVEIAEDAAEEEVLADIPERTFDFALRFRAIWPASAGLEAVMARQIDKRAIVDDEPFGLLADDGGLHAIVEDLAGSAADRLEGGDVAT